MISEKDIRQAKILIIDDQLLYVRLLENILKDAGYKNIHSTTNPKDVIRLYEEIKPDLILLDLKMPNADGFGMIQELKKIEPDNFPPLLALSAQMGQEIRLRALEAGATDFLTKPYESFEALMRIHNMIETRILNKQVREHNKDLEEKVSARTKELRGTQLEIIQRLARAAEFRDNDTGTHIIRMSKYCARLGTEAGMNDKEVELLLNASPLHDIGKIGIPDNILLKPSKLNPEEWEIMKRHPIIGTELLSGSNSEVMKLAQCIAATHHERWNGNGYPKGLKGEDIPLVGRISSLCDVFDALTTDRPYKKAWSVNAAVEEIKKESGKQFDPILVKYFIDILPDIITIMEEHQD